MSQRLLRILEVSRDITASQAVYDPLMHLDLMPVKAKVVNATPSVSIVSLCLEGKGDGS